MFEAWADAEAANHPEENETIQGRHLGILGSIIVADVIFGALTDRLMYEERDKPEPGPPKLADSLKRLHEAFFGEGESVFGGDPPPENMAQLVTYIANVARLQNAQPPFL